jgi:hypothetical protein
MVATLHVTSYVRSPHLPKQTGMQDFDCAADAAGDTVWYDISIVQ